MSKVYSNLTQSSESNVEPIKKQSFQIKDTSKIINILRDSLYKHKERTLVQEYVSNARDAVREKYKLELINKDSSLNPANYTGNDRAVIERKLRVKIDSLIKPTDIRVTVPTELNPFFKVRDYGVGLSPERIANVFTYYCESTKGDSDIETGGFGIGGKSAWAYTDHFTVISFYNGRRYTYTSHTEKQEGELCLDDECETTEANGVEIIVGVNPKDLNVFKNSIFRICYFWKTRPTITGITNADMPEWYDTKPDLSVENWKIFTGDWCADVINNKVFHDEATSFIFVLDGVPYAEALPPKVIGELNQMMSHHAGKGQRMIVAYEAELGSVDIVASRENLAKTPKTTAVIQKLTIKELLKSYYEKLDSETSTLTDRCKLFTKYHSLFGYYLFNELNITKSTKKYELSNFSYQLKSYTSPCAEVKVKDASKYQIFPVTIKYDINDKVVVSIGSVSSDGSFTTTQEQAIPVLIQDEELSVTNRRIKIIEFHKATKLTKFLLIQPSNILDTALALEAKTDLEGKFTSNFELVQTERQEIKRATGVYTLYHLNFQYYRHSKDKFQQSPSYFDSLSSPFLLVTEEEFKAFTRNEKDLMKYIQALGANLYMAAPSTISKLKDKKNIFMFKDFIKKLDKHLTLPEEYVSFLYKTYFQKMVELLEKDFGIFTTSENVHLISEIKDSTLRSALTRGTDLLGKTKQAQVYNHYINLQFLETHFNSVTKKVAAANYNDYYKELINKRTQYPLFINTKDPRLAKEVLVYINAKFQSSKK